ncbi:MAG: serine/threonine-protein kinase [Gemmataceae bacterium]
MPVHALTVPGYVAVLTRSRLLPDPEVEAVFEKWQAQGGADADVDGFRKFVAQTTPLTEYQAALLQRGHTDGFFLGGYVILDRLGKGQTAGVYKARHPSGQIVALKVLPASRAKNPRVLARFQREGRLLTQLDHPNVVRAFQLGQDHGRHFIVMEHLDGETLDEVLARRKQLPVGEAARLACQALHGLQHLHGKRMVHRDLKPSNLMVVPGDRRGPDTTLHGTVKILDIGIGRELFDDKTPDTRDLELTREGAILGTPDYLAPEQARDARTADVRADIYSLGCVLFHAIAGRPPYPETTAMGQMVQHATTAPPPLAAVAPGVPAGLQAVFDKMTAKRPADRYATPADAATALAAFLPSGGADAAASTVLPAYQEWLRTESADVLPVPPPSPPPPPPPITPRSEVNVELVATHPARSPFELTRRDLVMLGVGAVGTGLAVAAGVALARLR